MKEEQYDGRIHPATRRLSKPVVLPESRDRLRRHGTVLRSLHCPRRSHPDPAICANVIIGLIKVTHYLLDQQLRQLERTFLREGGLRERMTRARLAARNHP
jgi:four helix bundle suffix protein